MKSKQQDDSTFRDFLRKHEGHTITLQRREGGVRQSSSIRAVDFEKAKERPPVSVPFSSTSHRLFRCKLFGLDTGTATPFDDEFGEVTAAFCCGQKALRYAGDAR